MYTIEEIKTILTQAKPELQKKYPLSELAIFGSYARGEATEDSDIDVLVDFNGPVGLLKYISLSHKIQDLFNHKVDMVSKNGIKPKYWVYVSRNLIYV